MLAGLFSSHFTDLTRERLARQIVLAPKNGVGQKQA